MDRTKYHNILFLIGAIWNWAVAAALFILSVAMPTAFIDLGMQIPNTMVWFHCTVGFVGVFGFVYFIAYKDPSARRGIALSGVIEKFFIFIALATYFFTKDVGIVGLGLVIVDLAYGILLLEALRRLPAH